MRTESSRSVKVAIDAEAVVAAVVVEVAAVAAAVVVAAVVAASESLNRIHAA